MRSTTSQRSHRLSFETPEYTANSDALGTCGSRGDSHPRAAEQDSVLSGVDLGDVRVREPIQSESTPFILSPYGGGKVYAYWITVNTAAYGMHASNGILFNHEGPTRGETFVTRKIRALRRLIHLGTQDCLYLGNMEAKRDWGHAKDYVEGMWRMLQQDEPDDYVLATGEAYSVRQFVELSFAELGMTIRWQGSGVEEEGVCEETGQTVVRIDPRYFRPTEVEFLLGDATKARDRYDAAA